MALRVHLLGQRGFCTPGNVFTCLKERRSCCRKLKSAPHQLRNHPGNPEVPQSPPTIFHAPSSSRSRQVCLDSFPHVSMSSLDEFQHGQACLRRHTIQADSHGSCKFRQIPANSDPLCCPMQCVLESEQRWPLLIRAPSDAR